METSTTFQHHRHICHGKTEYQLITTGELQSLPFEEACSREAWEDQYPSLGIDTPRYYVDCVRLVALSVFNIVPSPGDKEYAIISHPWTPNLEELVTAAKDSCSTDGAGGGSYFDAISAGLCERQQSRLFEGLLELAQCIVSLGVRYMWIDVFCLDQCNADSMSFEIGRMYSYYKNSYCTIISLHGLENRTDLGEWPTAVARWFSRVWTLQEGVACHQIYFISAPVTGIFERVIAELMSNSPLPDDTIYQLLMSSQTRQDDVDTLRTPDPLNISVLPSNHVSCACCTEQCSVMVTKAETYIGDRDLCAQQKHFRSHLYNWQQAWLIMRWAVLIACTAEVKDAAIVFKALEAMFDFALSRRAEEKYSVSEILDRVCQRGCSHLEDRVLGVLGMLRIGATDTLRQGRTLYDQIKWLCTVASPSVRQALIVQNFIGMYDTESNSSWMPNLCQPALGFGQLMPELPIGEWDYDADTNRVIGKGLKPFFILLGKPEKALDIDEEILREEREMELMATDQSWWTIPLSLKPDLELPNNVVTLELLDCVHTNTVGEVMAGGPCYVSGYSVGALDIPCIVGSHNLVDWQVAIQDKVLVGLPVAEGIGDLESKDQATPAYDVALLLCTGTIESLEKVGGLVVNSSFAPDAGNLMWRHRQANSLPQTVYMG